METMMELNLNELEKVNGGRWDLTGAIMGGVLGGLGGASVGASLGGVVGAGAGVCIGYQPGKY